MRNIILSALFIILAFTGVAQDSILNINPPKASYLKRSSDQKIGGWVLVAAGMAGLIATLSSDAVQDLAAVGRRFNAIFSFQEYEPVEKKSYTGAYLLSGACIAGGIYLFTASAENKKRAKDTSMTMSIQKTEVLRYGSVYKRSFPAIGLKIRL